MRLVENVQTVFDMFTLASAAKNRGEERQARYGELALGLESQVLAGNIAPITAEAALDAELASQDRERKEPDPRNDKAAIALARLVERHVIDLVFAENILDRGFAGWSIDQALDDTKKNSRK